MEFPMHWLVILVVVLILFGGRKIPELMRGLGEGVRGFKEGMSGTNQPQPLPIAKLAHIQAEDAANVPTRISLRQASASRACRPAGSANSMHPLSTRGAKFG